MKPTRYSLPVLEMLAEFENAPATRRDSQAAPGKAPGPRTRRPEPRVIRALRRSPSSREGQSGSPA